MRTLYVVCMCFLGALPACGRSSAAASATPNADAAASVDAASGRGIRVDGQLLTSKRIAIVDALRRLPGGMVRLHGEVVSSETGEADVGVLVSGRVASLEVPLGAEVKRGQILAWVDSPEVGRATAELLRARARRVVAERKLARQLDLDRQQATSKNAIDEARADAETARADLVAARTLLASLGGGEPPEAKDDAGIGWLGVRVPVRAPIDGTIAQRTAILGGPVAPDKTLYRIVAQGKISVLARFPETSGAAPRVGARVTITARGAAEAARKSCPAKVAATVGTVDEATRTVPLRIDPDETCPWLLPGSYVDVLLTLAAGTMTADAGTAELIVPRDAIVEIHGTPTVFVPVGDGRFDARAVTVRVDGDDAIVERGLAEGDRVVYVGALLLKGEMLRAELEGN